MNIHNFNNDDELSKYGFSLSPPGSTHEYGFLSTSRGPMSAGVPGCGKSLLSIDPSDFGLGRSLISIDAADLKGSYVGESEAKVARLLSLTEFVNSVSITETTTETTEVTPRSSWKQVFWQNIPHIAQLVCELIRYLREKGFG